MIMKSVSVVGLGKLGAGTAACLSYRGFETIGVDINQSCVDLINLGKAPVVEPRLQELMTASAKRLRATLDYDTVILKTDVTMIIVPTPSKEDGDYSDKVMRNSLESLCVSLKKSDKDYHLFVICSTVSPKTCESSLIPLIEEKSGRKLNEGFGVCYNPEFIALGDVINDTLQPDLVLIGESDKKAGDILQGIYEQLTENEPVISRMSVVSAEITKIALNSFVTMKISFANTLSNICEQIDGANVDDVTLALGADRRISPYYLKGGISFGGPCFPRDNRAFSKFANDHGVKTPLAKSTDLINKHQIKHLLETVNNYAKTGDTVGVLGLSYKPKTPVIEESPALYLIHGLLEHNIGVTVYDSLAQDSMERELGNKISYNSSMSKCVERSDILVITTLESEFNQINIPNDKKIIIIDCWRALSDRKFSNNVTYHAVGVF